MGALCCLVAQTTKSGVQSGKSTWNASPFCISLLIKLICFQKHAGERARPVYTLRKAFSPLTQREVFHWHLSSCLQVVLCSRSSYNCLADWWDKDGTITLGWIWTIPLPTPTLHSQLTPRPQDGLDEPLLRSSFSFVSSQSAVSWINALSPGCQADNGWARWLTHPAHTDINRIE